MTDKKERVDEEMDPTKAEEAEEALRLMATHIAGLFKQFRAEGLTTEEATTLTLGVIKAGASAPEPPDNLL